MHVPDVYRGQLNSDPQLTLIIDERIKHVKCPAIRVSNGLGHSHTG